MTGHHGVQAPRLEQVQACASWHGKGHLCGAPSPEMPMLLHRYFAGAPRSSSLACFAWLEFATITMRTVCDECVR